MKLKNRANLWAAMAMAAPGTALAGDAVSSRMVDAICGIVEPLIGSGGGGSKMLSLVFLIALGVMVFLWWMSENKEGAITWILRTGIALGALINLFTLPSLVGLPSVC